MQDPSTCLPCGKCNVVDPRGDRECAFPQALGNRGAHRGHSGAGNPQRSTGLACEVLAAYDMWLTGAKYSHPDLHVGLSD